jgi:PTH1 family peptidyl-tRNA hydrolase
MELPQEYDIKVIIGLGNPVKQYEYTLHNIGFLVVDTLADKHAVNWQSRDNMLHATIMLCGKKIILIKPQTFMNNSGAVASWLTKQGIKPENMLVIHDELEKPYAKVTIRIGGSARGHNGLRSLIQACGPDFIRLRCGIGRPERKEEVGDYVLEKFNEPTHDIAHMIDRAIMLIEQSICG